MTKLKPDHDPDHDPDHANDNDASNAPSLQPAASALAPLTALGRYSSCRHHVHRRPLNSPAHAIQEPRGGTWVFGQKRTIPEHDSLWAVNPPIQVGLDLLGDGNKVIGESLVPISQPLPDVTELPDNGFPWQQQMAVNLKCLDGADAGTEVMFKPTPKAAREARRIDRDDMRPSQRNQHDGKVSPIVLLEKDSYPHSQFGKVWTPTLTVVDWMLLSGPAPAPKPTSPPPTEQPRRRRVG